MIKTRLITLTFLILLCQATSSHAVYTVDGKIDDWGFSGTNALSSTALFKNFFNNNLPSGGRDIDVAKEDNDDIFQGWNNVGPGYSAFNRYDAEALYFDNDDQYAYIAIITGLPSYEVSYPAGDIFIDTGLYQKPGTPGYDAQKLYRYQYGLSITTKKLYLVDAWTLNDNFTESDPWRIPEGVINDNTKKLGDVQFAYSTIYQYSHYVLEARIPLNLLALNYANVPGGSQADIWLHWTMKCGNDYLNLKGDVNEYNQEIPEPVTLVLFGSGFLGLLGVKKRFV